MQKPTSAPPLQSARASRPQSRASPMPSRLGPLASSSARRRASASEIERVGAIPRAVRASQHASVIMPHTVGKAGEPRVCVCYMLRCADPLNYIVIRLTHTPQQQNGKEPFRCRALSRHCAVGHIRAFVRAVLPIYRWCAHADFSKSGHETRVRTSACT